MKKIILIMAGALIAVVGYSQNNATSPAIKTLTVAEANRLTGVAQPTINGIPYSQYKAQQDALKQPGIQQPGNNGGGNGTPVQPGTVRPVTAPPANIHIPDKQPATNAVSTTTVSAAKTNVSTEKAVVVPTPAIQTIPVGSFKSSPLTPTPVGATPIASKTTVTTPANGGPAIALPAITTATANAEVEAKQVASPTDNAPKQVITEARPAVIQEVPNSVVSPASKLPVVPNQTAGKAKN